MLEHLTTKTQHALQQAQQHALLNDCPTLDPLHILVALLEDTDNGCQPLLSFAGGDSNAILNEARQQLQKLPKTSDNGEVSIGRDSARILNLAFKQAQKSGDTHVAADLLLTTLAREHKVCKQLFEKHGVEMAQLKQALEKNRRGQPAQGANAEGGYRALEKYTVNISEQARQGKLDPVIGRNEEIRRTIHILQRRSKNNPVLIGAPGVGKTAIVEGLAQRLLAGEAPEDICNKEILALDIASLLAGAKYRGEFEERLKMVLKEINERNDVIVFIDELHTLVGAGNSEGAVDAANMLKPALARGELHCIGATTLDEYRQYIEKDAALERRFQKIIVPEPSIEAAIAILRGLGGRYEAHHGVRITDPAIVAAVELSARYITDRFLPDKAIDLIDEAAARMKIEASSKPEALDRLLQRLTQLRIEEQALLREKDSASQKRLATIRTEIAKLEKESADLEEIWNKEHGSVERVRHLQQEHDRLTNDMARAQRDGNWQRLSEIQYGELPALLQQIEQEKTQQFSLLKTELGANEIAEAVAAATGIPVSNLLADERHKLLTMEEAIKTRVIGQDIAVKAVCQAVRRARAGIAEGNRPLGNFLFLGPTGVGKTELCKALAACLFDSEKKLLRFDMSEYMEKHSVARLIGAPPGYVGFDAGGQLTEAVRRQPFAVILLDEIEKAHPDVFNILLQVLDDGRMTDGRGRTVDFSNTIIIMTANLAAERIQQATAEGTLAEQHEAIITEVRRFFRPEFFNRIDDCIIFNPLTLAQMQKIVEVQLQQLQQQLAQRNLTLTVHDSFLKKLAREGFVPELGARPLKRLIQERIQNQLADLLLQNPPAVENGGIHITIDSKGKMTLRPIAD